MAGLRLVSAQCALLCATAILLCLLRGCACQMTLDEGALSNGVPASASITRGDSDYWTFVVSSQAGSPWTDLSIVLVSSSGQSALAIIAPDGSSLRPTAVLGNSGLLLTNRTVDTLSTSTSATASWPPLQAGAYLLQVYAGQEDVYSLTASLTQRLELSASMPAALFAINGSLPGGSSSYADYLVADEGPVALTLTMSSQSLPASVQLPVVYWARDQDVPAWQPSLVASGSFQPSSGQPDAIVTINDNCALPPCRYSILFAPSSTLEQPVQVAVTANWTVDTELDYALNDDKGDGLNVDVTTAKYNLQAGLVHYHVFQVLDPQANITLSLTGCAAEPPGAFIMLVSINTTQPDQSAGGSQWSASNVGQPTSAQSLNVSILPTSSQFSPGGAASGQQTTMEGQYTVLVYAHTSACYTLRLLVADRSNLTAPVLTPDRPIIGIAQPGQMLYFRFTTPRAFDLLRTDIVLSAVNVSLYVSDASNTPGPADPLVLPGGVAVASAGQPTMVRIASGTSSLHAGTYYIGLINTLAQPTPFSVVLSFTVHALLAANSTWVSDTPLAALSVRYLDYEQPGLTTQTVLITIAASDPTTSAALYVQQTGRVFPYSTNLSPLGYPSPSLAASYSYAALSMNNGVLTASITYVCAFQYSCVWQMSLVSTSTAAIDAYTVALQVQSGQVATTLQVSQPVSGTLTGNISQAVFQLQALQYSVLQLTLSTTGTDPLMLKVDSDHVLLTGQAGSSSQYTAFTSANVNGTLRPATLLVSPAGAVFGVTASNNIGAPFLGTWYVAVVCNVRACLSSPFTLTYTTQSYTGNVSTLVPAPIATGSPLQLSLQARQYAFYSFVCPSPLPSDSDIIIAVGPTLSGSWSGGPDIFVSLTQQLPTIQNLDWQYSIFGAGISQSVTLSADDNSLPGPGQTVYFSVYAAHLRSLRANITVSVTRRLTLSGQGQVQLPSPVVPGTAQLVDLVLVGQSNPSLYVSNSFVYSLVSSNGTDLLPTAAVDRLLQNADQWSQTFGILATQLPFSPSVLNSAQLDDDCSRYAGTCVYRFLLYFPTALPDATFAVNALSQVQSSESGLGYVNLTTTSDLTLTLTAGELRIYRIDVPAAWSYTAVVSASATPTSQSSAVLLMTAGTGDVPYAWVDPTLRNASGGPGRACLLSTPMQPPFSPVVYVAVQAVTAGSVRLIVNVVDSPVASTTSSSLQLSAASPAAVYMPANRTQQSVVRLVVPADFNASSDLYVVAADPTMSTNVSVSMLLFKNVYPAPAAVAYLLGDSSRWSAQCVQTPSGSRGVSLVVSSQAVWSDDSPSRLLTLSVQAGDVLYVVLPGSSQAGAWQLTASYCQRQALGIGGTVLGSLSVPLTAQTYAVSVTAQKVDGHWYTPVRFSASLTLPARVASVPSQGVFGLYATLPSPVRSPLPFTSFVPPYLGSDLSSSQSQQSQQLDVDDVCLQAVCIYTLLVLNTQPSQTATAYSLALGAPTAPQPLVPGVSTPPTAIADGAMQYYSFNLPHPAMTATVQLQSLLTPTAGGNANANADLFVSSAYQWPDAARSQLMSQLDDPHSGYDQVTFTGDVSAGQQTVYVGVLGERAGQYQLLVTIADAGSPDPYISNQQAVQSSVSVGWVDYYRYPIGQVAATTDLSVLCMPSADSSAQQVTGQLFATFSYSHPGPYDGTLPVSLSYEMLTNASSTVQQLTLTQSLSSSNLLPLNSQTTLYLAVVPQSSSGLASSVLQYALAVSLSQRVTLTVSPAFAEPVVFAALSSATFTRVSAGAVQYFQLPFALPLPSSGTSAVLVLTGLSSPASTLPALYATSALLSAARDPVVSSPGSYSVTAAVSSAASQCSAVAMQLAPLCPSMLTTCTWKALVPALTAVPEYTLALNLLQDGDQAALQANLPLVASVASGQLLFVTFTLAAGTTAASLVLRTLDSAGNADLFVSTTALSSHPSPAEGSYTWSSVSDSLSSPIDVVDLMSGAAPPLTSAVTYYASVLGQRSTAFQLVLNVTLNTSGSQGAAGSFSSSSSSASSSSSSSSTGGGTAALYDAETSSGGTNALVPVVGVLGALLVVLSAAFVGYVVARSKWAGTSKPIGIGHTSTRKGEPSRKLQAEPSVGGSAIEMSTAYFGASEEYSDAIDA